MEQIPKIKGERMEMKHKVRANRDVIMKRFIFLVLVSVLIFALLPLNSVHVNAEKYEQIPENRESTLATAEDGAFHAGDFRKLILNYVVPHGFNSMIFVFGQCFGGGFFLDLYNRSWPVEQIAASQWNEESYSGTDESDFLKPFAIALYDNSFLHLGSFLLYDSFQQANQSDPCGPDGALYAKYPENPVYNMTPGRLHGLGNQSYDATSWKAILWVGEGSTSSWNDLNRIHSVLTRRYGFDDLRDIYVCFGTGTWDGTNTLPDGGKIDSPAYGANLTNAFKNWLGPQMNGSVQFFFWASDHGGTYEYDDRCMTPPNTYEISLDYSIVQDMLRDPNNHPFVSFKTFNVIGSGNGVYLNNFFLGDLTPTGPGAWGNDTFYFNDNVVPLYSSNTLRLEGSGYEVYNFSIYSGNIAQGTTPSHDIAVTSITPSATQAYPTWTDPLKINVTVANEGNFNESFPVTLYWNSTHVIGTQTVNVPTGDICNQTQTWAIPSIPFAYPYPIYILSANATVSGNINSGILTCGSVTVKWPGDANGDGHVNGFDLYIMAVSWHQPKGTALYDPRADFLGHGTVNGFDLYWLAVNWHRGPLD
jgi:hypothetical protein